MNDEAENEPPPKQQRIRKQVHDELDGFSGASDDEGSESAAPVMCSRLALFINWKWFTGKEASQKSKIQDGCII